MSLYDLIERAKAVMKKYEKFDAPQEAKKGTTNDPFTEEYQEIEAEIDRMMEIAGDVVMEKNRAIVASKNGEIRSAKKILLEDAIKSLNKKIKKGKGITKPIIADREEKVNKLIDKIYSIPDGMSVTANKRPYRPGQGTGKGGKVQVQLATSGSSSSYNPLYHAVTEEAKRLDDDFQIAKKRQDAVLDRVEEGVFKIKNIANDLGEALDEQDPILNEIDHQINRVTGQLKNNNAKLKGIVHKMRSKRNFCMDAILIVLLLGIIGYLITVI